MAAIRETWRVDEGWWRAAPVPGSEFRVPSSAERRRTRGDTADCRLPTADWGRGISRLYYAVVLEDGRPHTLFQDLLGDGWYVQRG
ncbi:MAG: hypothetical protein HYY05_07790 [Chloroflexi bacterium]|nr:hypothetical protein [Chloroflexota bacterium]